jgi:hypothetical protein
MNKLNVVEHRILCKDDQYNSFPSIVKRRDGTYILTFRRAPDRQKTFGHVSHIDPASFAAKLESPDGNSWDSAPSVLYDDFFCGVQDPRLNVLRDGKLLCTFFKWKVTEKGDPVPEGSFTHNVYGKWTGTLVGSFSIRSTDGGSTWDEPVQLPGTNAAIQGDCAELEDGSVIALTYGQVNGVSNVYVLKSRDCGLTWVQQSVIPGCDGYHFHEPNLRLAPSGKLVAFIRTAKVSKDSNSGSPNSPLYTSESLDGGVTWSRPVPRAFYSPSPFHVLDLGDDGVFVSYGYRYEPYGIRAFLLNAECDNWEEAEELIVREDGGGVDLGYTSAARLHDGTILLTYYYFDKPGGSRYIAGTVCSLQ